MLIKLMPMVWFTTWCCVSVGAAAQCRAPVSRIYLFVWVVGWYPLAEDQRSDFLWPLPQFLNNDNI